MAASENRLMALTYISAYVDGDDFQIKAIQQQMTKDELIDELAQVGSILAVTVGMFMDKETPSTVADVMETLRQVSNRDS